MKKLFGITVLAGLYMLIAVGAAFGESNENVSSGLIEITEFKTGKIPMYKKPGGKPFDFLVFEEQTFDDIGNADGGKEKALAFFTQNGSLFSVYEVQEGWNAARQISDNKYYHSGQPFPIPWPGVPGPEHILKFAITGNPDVQWLKVAPYCPYIDGFVNVDGAWMGKGFSAPAPFYIERDESCMRFISWAKVVKTTYTFVCGPDIIIHDSPDGKPLDKPFEVRGGYVVGELQGDWLQANFFEDQFAAYETYIQGWIRWHDADGLVIIPKEMHIGGPLI